MIPAFGRLLDLISPGVDYAQPGGFLQIAVFSAGVVMFGLAAATAVSGWATDEGAGRLDVVLAAPISRRRWALLSGLGALAAAPVVGTMMAAAVALGTNQVGGDPWTPAVGTIPLALYMLAMTGVGIAIAGLTNPGIAAPAVVVIVVASYLVELIGGALRLPDWLMGLALNHYLGLPMVGTFDPFGIGLSVGLTLGGLLLGAWGLTRRDLRG
jgi:ABC-2 type transport system permease protein